MILHVDMDAFYASVEERDQPALRGQPVIVGGTAARGVVCAANYIAREFGVHSAMPTSTAHRLCPHAVFLPSRMDHYAAISREIRAIFHRYTPVVEPLSLDEAFLDVSGSEGLFGTAEQIGHQIQRAIGSELGLIASVGVAPNKFLAKIGSDLEKPAGFVVVKPDAVQAFLDRLPVSRLWGVGRVSGGRMQQLHIRTIADLRRLSLEDLQQHFGMQAEHFWELARGIDDRKVIPDRDAKSISHETTFATDIDDEELLLAWLLELTDQVARRLRRHDLIGTRIVLKIRFPDFRTISRSKKLTDPTNRTDELWRIGRDLLKGEASHPIRLLGMGVSDLRRTGLEQQHLFESDQRRKQKQIDEVGDQLLERFGRAALRRGSSVAHNVRHQPAARPDDEEGETPNGV